MNSNTIQINIAVDDRDLAKIKGAGATITDMGEKGDRAGNLMAGAFGKLALTLGAISFVQMAREIGGIMDTYTLLEGRLRLVTTGAENLAMVQGSLYDISLRTHVSQASTIELYTRMARATDQLGYSQQTTLQITETINQAMIVSGATATEANAALIQLSQGLGSGVLRGEEFNSVMEQTPRLARAIADGLGVNTGELRKMAEQGQLTSEVVTRALISQRDVIESEFGQMTKTIGQAWTDLGTVFQSLVHQADKGAGGTNQVVDAIDNLASAIDENREPILALFEGIVNGAAESVDGIISVSGRVMDFGETVESLVDMTGFDAMDWGVIGAVLFKGGAGAAGIAAAVVTLNNQLGSFGMNLGSLGGKWDAYTESFNNFVDGISGVRDWNTGALVSELSKVEKKISDIREAQENRPWQLFPDPVEERRRGEEIKTALESLETKRLELITGNQKYSDSWMIAAQASIAAGTTIGGVQSGIKDSWEILGELQKTSAKEIDAAEVKIFKEKQAREEKGAKERADQLKKEEEGRIKYTEEISRLEAQLTGDTNRNAQSRHDYALQKLEEQYQAKVADAGSDVARITEVARWHKAERDRLFTEDTSRSLQQRTQENAEETAHLTDLATKNQEYHDGKVLIGDQWVAAVGTNIATIDASEAQSRAVNWAAEEQDFKDKKARLEKELAARAAHAIEVKKLEEDLTARINEATMSRFDLAVLKLDDEIAEMRLTAGENEKIQDQITAHHLLELLAMKADGATYSTDEVKRLEDLLEDFEAYADGTTTATADALEDQEDLSDEMTKYLNKASGNDLVNLKAALKDQYDEKVLVAGKDKALRAQVDAWYKAEQELIVTEDAARSLAKKKSESDAVATHLHDLTLKHQDYWQVLTGLEETWAEASKAIQAGLGDALVEEFGQLEGAWGALWDTMLRKMGSVIAEMAVNWAFSGVATLFKGWQMPQKFHEGIWTLKDDEVPAILQMGEMVIPRGYADEIRTFLGGNGPDNWGGLMSATRNYGAKNWGSETDGVVAGHMQGTYSDAAIAGFLGVVAGQVTPGRVFSGLVSPEFATSAVVSALAETAVSPWSPEPSNHSNFGAATGRGLMMAGLAAAGLPGMASGALGSLGALAGGWVGDVLGDAFDARSIGAVSVEGIYDAMEDGDISQAQGRQMVRDHVAQMTREMQRIDDEPTLGLFSSSLASSIDKQVSYLERMMGAAAASHTAAQMTVSETGGGGLGSTGEYGWGSTAHGHDESGDFDGGSASDDGYGYGDDNAYSTGGIVKRLLVPQGDDGWGALKLGEGVIDADTMKILSAAIRAGQFPTQKDGGNEELVALLWTIASSTKKSADILTRIEYTGIPQTDRRAVA